MKSARPGDEFVSIDVDKIVDETEVWADLDGCEGGDFIRLLAEGLRMAQGGGYSYRGDDVVASLLLSALTLELEAHAQQEPHQTPEFVEESMRTIREIRER